MESNHDQSVVVEHFGNGSNNGRVFLDGGGVGNDGVLFLDPKKAKGKKLVDQSVVDQIMNGLRDGQPRKTLEIAKFCGFQTKQEVNPTLYYMQKQRLLAKVCISVGVVYFSHVACEKGVGEGERGSCLALHNL